MSELKWLWEHLKRKRLLFLVAMLMALLSSALYLFYPFLSQAITDRVLIGTMQADGTYFHDTANLIPLLTVMLFTQSLRMVNRYGMILILERVSQGLQQKLRVELYANLSSQDSAFFHEFRTGDLMTRLTGDMDMVRHTVAWLSYNIVESCSLFLFSIAYFFSINAKLTLILFALTPLIMLATYKYARSVYPLFASLREKLSKMNSMAQENISGNKVIRAFVREHYETDKFDQRNQDYHDANLAASFHWLRFFPVIEGFSRLMGILIILFGGLFIIRGEMTAGDLLAFSLLSWGISGPMQQMGMYLNDLQRFFTSVTKIMEIHMRNTKIASPQNGYISSGSMKGKIEFRNVSYRFLYTEQMALDQINLTIHPGETIAIMGSTGSGKTTLVQAISRLMDVTKGAVLVDGIDVRQWDLQALRKQIGVATQDVLLYSNSVDANIAYGNPELSEEEVHRNAELAAAQFIEALPMGYDTVIGERGTGLSGGQKQRIALARALAIRPSILILDDTTSAVDTETEHYIQNSLRNLPFSCTKLIIAQRITSVRDADHIVIMENGAITEFGTHEELIAKHGYYYDVCAHQGALEAVSVNG